MEGRRWKIEGTLVSRDRQGALRAAFAALVLAPSFAVAQVDPSDIEYYEPETVREAAADVLDSPEFRHLPRLGDGAEASGADAKKAEPPKPDESPRREWNVPGLELLSSLVGGVVQVGFLLLLAAALAGLGFFIVRGLRWPWRTAVKKEAVGADAAEDEPEPLVTPGEKPADVYLSQARAAAAAGRFDEALALLLLGAMGHAERAGLIRPRRGLTYRDYLRAVPASSAWRPALDRLVRLYAPVGFGRRDATSEAFESAVGPYEHALTAEPSLPGTALPDGRG